MKTKLLIFLMCAFGFIGFTGCSTDVENNNTIIIPGYGGTEVVKTGSNLLVNVGENKYGEKTQALSRAMTRASVDKQTISVNTKEQIKEPSIGLYLNYSWNTYSNGNPIYTGTSNGYLFANTTLTTPYKTDWSVSNSIDNGTLTLNSESLDDKYAKPVPVTFWGNHKLVTSDAEKTVYDPSDPDWKDAVVSSTTKSVAISKSIEYANSAVKMNLTLGTNGVLGWYDKFSTSKDEEDVTTIAVTEDNVNTLPAANTTTYEINGKQEKIIHIDNVALRTPGYYFHYKVGNAIKIAQSNTGAGNWHFVGPDEADDINFEVVETRIASSKSCTYKNDYQYVPSTDEATYKYELNESLQSGESAVFSIMPTSQTTSVVVLKCKITKFPVDEKEHFYWYIKESIKDNAPYIKVGDNSIFYIIGKISTSDKTIPTGSPYSTTWNKGIYCPDVITNVNVHIDDLCVDGSVVRDPDGSDDTNINKIYYNFDYEYGTMDGVWTTGNTNKN